MVYITPAPVVYQELLAFPAEIVQPLRPHISGGHAWLVRYSDAAEKILGLLGAYSPTSDVGYAWPSRPVGAVVDLNYTKLFIDDALLEYFVDLIGTGSTIAPVSGYTDRIRSSSLGFRTNTASFPRSADFFDRDVTVGDRVHLRGIVSGDPVELDTYVRGFGYERTAAVTGTATADASNAGARASSSTVTFVSGPENCITISPTLTDYSSWQDGDVNEVYTVEVIQGSVAGDFTTARLRVTSASGNDDDLLVTPAVEGDDFAVGVRGLELSFIIGGEGESCSLEEPDLANELRVGQVWRVAVSDFTQGVTPTAAGTYTGDRDATYLVEVSRGGRFDAADAADLPQISVRTTTGADLSGPTTVTTYNVAVSAGTKGLTIKFVATSGTLEGLIKGDKFYIPATAAKNGRVSTLILGHALGDLVDATDMDLKLYIRKDLEITENRVGASPLVNWETSATEVTVIAGITAYDSTWTDGGTQMPLEVMGGQLYVQYRAWLQDLIDGGSISANEDLDDVIPGALSYDNPLKMGVHIARLNSNGTTVKFHAVSDPSDSTDWLDVLDQLDGADETYNVVPLTHDLTIQNAYAGFVNTQSAPEVGFWRGAFFGLQIATTIDRVSAATSSDGEPVLATITDDSETSGTQYTLLTVPASTGDFVANEVRAGDIVRTNYRTDGFDGELYDEFVVDTVINEDLIRLVSGPTAPINAAQKIEIWHARTKSEQAAAYAAAAGGFGSQRVCAIWDEPGQAESRPSYYAAAAAAGRRGGVVPQQGMTNLALTGLQSTRMVGRARFFNRTQLDTMATAGVYIVTQADTGEVYARHALTTDMTSLETREEAMRANKDSMAYYFKAVIKKFIGVSNVTPELLATLRVELDSAIDVLKGTTLTGRVGAQLIDGRIVELRQHALLKDRVVAVINLVRPAPLNNIDLYLVG